MNTHTVKQNGNSLPLIAVFYSRTNSSCIRNAQCVLSIETKRVLMCAICISKKCANVFIALRVLSGSNKRSILVCFHSFRAPYKWKIKILSFHSWMLALDMRNAFSQLKQHFLMCSCIRLQKSMPICLLDCVCCLFPANESFTTTFIA